MLRPGPRLFPALLASALLASLAAWHGFLIGISLGVLALILLGAAAEAWQLRRWQLQAQWPTHSVRSLGQDEALALTVIAGAGCQGQATIRCRWPEVLGFRDSLRTLDLTPMTEQRVEFPVLACQRGEAALESPSAATTRWGLVERIQVLPASGTVSVMPDLSAVKRLRHQLDAFFLRGQGSRLAPRVGQGREFDRLREYVNGDDFRHLAWKASGRRGKLIVQSYRVERSQDILFCIDHGHRMAGAVTGGKAVLTRLDHALNAAVLNCWLCNRCEDRVGMLSFSSRVDDGVPQGRGAQHLSRITAFATAVTVTHLPSDYRALASHLRRRLRSRTLVLLMTTLPERGNHDDLLMAVRMLIPRHLPLVLALDDPQLESEAEAMPEDHAALCRRIAAADIVDDRAQLTRELRQLGALVVHTTPADAGNAAVNAYMSVKRRQLL